MELKNYIKGLPGPALRNKWCAEGKYWRAGSECVELIAKEAKKYGYDILDKRVQATYGIHEPRLHEFQARSAATALRERRWFFADEMGLGKTAEAITATRILDPRKVLVVCPAIVRWNWLNEFKKWWPENKTEIGCITAGQENRSGSKKEKARRLAAYGASFKVTSYNLLSKLKEQKDWDVILFDECFDGTVLVDTPTGKRRIDTLKPDDEVYGEVAGQVVVTRVQHAFRHYTTKPLLNMCGFLCTTNHPIWVEGRGYIAAESVGALDTVLCLGYNTHQGVHYASKLTPVLVRDVSCEVSKFSKGGTLLQPELSKQLHVKSPGVQAGGEGAPGEAAAGLKVPEGSTGVSSFRAQSVQQPSDSSPGPNSFGKGGVCPFDGRKRNWTDYSRAHSIGLLARVSAQLCNFVRKAQGGVSNKLQGRLGYSRVKNWCRSRRPDPQQFGGPGERFQEGRDAIEYGMAYPSLSQQKNPVPNGIGSGIYKEVYNIETGSGNYFASGVLVHNCHRLKNPAANWAKAARQLVIDNPGAHMYGLSATMMPNAPLDACGIVECVCPERFGGLNKFGEIPFGLKNRYANATHNGYGWKFEGLNPLYADELASRLRGMSSRTTKLEVAHLLPPFDVHYLEIRPNAPKEFRSILEDVGKSFRSHTEKIDLALLKSGQEKISAAIEWAQDAMQSNTHITICTHLKETAHEIARGLEPLFNVYCITGEVPPEKRNEQLAQAKADSSAIIVATMHSVGIGIDLTFCPVACLAELYYRPETVIQLLGRFSRLSGKVPSSVTIMVVKGSIDEAIAFALQVKIQALNQAIQGGLSETTLVEKLTGGEQDFLALVEEAAASMLENPYDC